MREKESDEREMRERERKREREWWEEKMREREREREREYLWWERDKREREMRECRRIKNNVTMLMFIFFFPQNFNSSKSNGKKIFSLRFFLFLSIETNFQPLGNYIDHDPGRGCARDEHRHLCLIRHESSITMGRRYQFHAYLFLISMHAKCRRYWARAFQGK